MNMDGKIGDEKLEYDINREAEKISALSPEKINKYEYLTGEEILPSNQRRVVEYTKFAYSPLGKFLEKQTKTIEDQRKKHIKQLKIVENNWLNLMNLLKRILISTEIVYHMKNK